MPVEAGEDVSEDVKVECSEDVAVDCSSNVEVVALMSGCSVEVGKVVVMFSAGDVELPEFSGLVRDS